MKRLDLTFLWRQSALLLLSAYVLLLGGGFAALVDFRLQLISTVIAGLVLGGWLLKRIGTPSLLPTTGVEWGWLAFVAVQFVAVAFSEDPRRSLPAAITWLAYAVIFFFVVDLLRRGWHMDLFAKALLIAGAIGMAFAVYQLISLFMSWLQITAAMELAPSFEQRISGIMGDPNLLAASTYLLIPLATAMLLISKGASRLLFCLFLAAAAVVLYFTDSRGGLLGMAAGLGVFVVLWVAIVSGSAKRRAIAAWHYLWGRKLLLALLGILVAAGLVFVAWQQLSFQGDTTHGPVATARDIYWDAAVNAIAKDPLTGAGPNMFPVYLMQIWSTPPARPYLHAHSFPFQLAAESGVLGLAGFILLIGLVIWRAEDAWRDLTETDRAFWVAAVAGLSGLAIHSLVDDFFPFPAVGAIAMVLLAFVLHPKPKAVTRPGFSPAWLLLPGLAAVAFTAFALRATWHADQAVTASEGGDWQRAATEMQAAAEADPSFAFYWLQLGYVYGRTGEGSWPEAIDAYENGIVLEPGYSLNHINLAMIHWASSDESETEEHLRIAITRAPDYWLAPFNLGLLQEEQAVKSGASEMTDAVDNLVRSIALEPAIAGAAIWQTTPARELAQSQSISMETSASEEESILEDARNKIDLGDFAAAREALSQAHALNDQSVPVYIALGELALAEGDLQLAKRYVETALWIQTTNNQDKVEAVLLGAEVAMASGDTGLAIQRYEAAYQAIVAHASYGWGLAGWSPYAWFVFQRRAFPEDLLPMTPRADIPADFAERLLSLADLYDASGRNEDGAKLRLALGEYLIH